MSFSWRCARGTLWLFLSAGGLAIASAAHGPPLPLSGPIRFPADHHVPLSLTCGIQEAIDSLPDEGGTVYVPAGTYLLENPILMRSNVTLRGSGRGTVLKRAPVFMLRLSENARTGQDFVRVEDASLLKPGMVIALGEDGNRATVWQHMYFVTKLGDDNKVYLRGRAWPHLVHDFSVDKNARLMNLMMGIWPAANSVIADLALDGAAETQMPEEAAGFCSLYQLPNGIYPLNAAARVEGCWVYNWLYDGIQVNGAETYVTIRGCHIYNNRGHGIHVGGGPRTLITQNTIHGNALSGVYFCQGNRGLVVTENFIYDNGNGIGGINEGDPALDTTRDLMSIIAHNIIYRNRGSGITTSWRIAAGSARGPRHFVISGNVVENNLLNPAPGEYPAGIVLVNAEECIVIGNRVVDDQDTFHRVLAADVSAGDTAIPVAVRIQDYMNVRFPVKGRTLVIEDTSGQEKVVVAGVSLGRAQHVIALESPLQNAYRIERDARIVSTKTQDWGIICIWQGQPDHNRGNVLSGNVVSGNRTGGILWSGRDMAVSGNAGEVVAVDENRPLTEQIDPGP